MQTSNTNPGHDSSPRLSHYKAMAHHFDDSSTNGYCQSPFYVILKPTNTASCHCDSHLCEVA